MEMQLSGATFAIMIHDDHIAFVAYMVRIHSCPVCRMDVCIDWTHLLPQELRHFFFGARLVGCTKCTEKSNDRVWRNMAKW